MPESEDPVDAGVRVHEQFVQDMREIDLAYERGRLQEWLEEKLADERRAAAIEPIDAVGF